MYESHVYTSFSVPLKASCGVGASLPLTEEGFYSPSYLSLPSNKWDNLSHSLIYRLISIYYRPPVYYLSFSIFIKEAWRWCQIWENLCIPFRKTLFFEGTRYPKFFRAPYMPCVKKHNLWLCMMISTSFLILKGKLLATSVVEVTVGSVDLCMILNDAMQFSRDLYASLIESYEFI